MTCIKQAEPDVKAMTNKKLLECNIKSGRREISVYLVSAQPIFMSVCCKSAGNDISLHTKWMRAELLALFNALCAGGSVHLLVQDKGLGDKAHGNTCVHSQAR